MQAVDWEGGLDDTLSSVMGFIPKLLVFLVVLFIGWIIAKVVSKALGMVLEKLGFNKLLEKAGADDMLRSAEISPISLLTKLVYYFILLIALQLALTAFGPSNPVSTIVNDIVAWLPKALVAIVIIIIAAAVANAVKDILGGSLSGLSYGPMLTKIVGGFIIALGVIAALNQVGIGLSVTLPVLIAVLATVGGVIVVGVGGGLIGPMRTRWEGWLNSFENETRRGTSSGATTGATTGVAYDDPPPPAADESYRQPPQDPGGQHL